MGYILNGVESGGIPKRLLTALHSWAPIDYFVETGTAGGESIEVAYLLFPHCWTIEIVPGRAGSPIPDVEFLTGDSLDLLPEIIQRIPDNKVCLFWLDAHYSDPEPTDGPECPLMDELKALSKKPNSMIIIDDARLFLNPPPYPLDPRKWPMIQDIFIKLRDYFPWHYTTIVDDYIICVPQEYKGAIEKEWRDNYSKRYPSESDKLKTQASAVFAAFINYIK